MAAAKIVPKGKRTPYWIKVVYRDPIGNPTITIADLEKRLQRGLTRGHYKAAVVDCLTRIGSFTYMTRAEQEPAGEIPNES